MPGQESQRSIGLRREHSAHQRKQTLGERVCNTNLRHCALGEGDNLAAPVRFLCAASDDLGIYGDAIQSIADLVAAAASYLADDFQSAGPGADTVVSHSDPHRRARLRPPPDPGAAAACAAPPV